MIVEFLAKNILYYTTKNILYYRKTIDHKIDLPATLKNEQNNNDQLQHTKTGRRKEVTCFPVFELRSWAGRQAGRPAGRQAVLFVSEQANASGAESSILLYGQCQLARLP